MSDIIVYGFSHDGPDEDDPQVYEKLIPDMGMRLWHAGWGDPRRPEWILALQK